jgi:hypothetical protein
MDIYHIWCNLHRAVDAQGFVGDVNAYLSHLRKNGGLASYRVTRRKLGLGPDHLGEFHIMMEFDNLGDLDETFFAVARRNDPIEELHKAVYSKVCDVTFALYRDFPGQEREPVQSAADTG